MQAIHFAVWHEGRVEERSGCYAGDGSDDYFNITVCIAHRHGEEEGWLLQGYIDFQKLNKITEVDPESMTTTENLFQRLSGKKFLSKIDLTKGYWQITVALKNVHKTAFVTSDGQCEFTRMSFGMAISGASLVRGQLGGLRIILEQ